MEKIKAALAKVKSKKAVRVKSNKPLTKGIERKVEGDIGFINYTTSTVIELDPDHLDSNRIVSHLSHNVNASIFDSLRTQTLQKMEENNWQSIAVVSPTAESGKTLVSINLAISVARQPKKTAVLVDFDLRKPKVAKYLGVNVETSLNEYLEGNASIESAMVNPSIQRLIVMPTMRPIINASEALSSSKVSTLVDELDTRYESRISIYDLPPLLAADDAMIMLPQVDCVLMVVANGTSTPTEIEDALDLIPKDKLIGVVYNKAEEENNKAYYY